jgi:hypothetical protein
MKHAINIYFIEDLSCFTIISNENVFHLEVKIESNVHKVIYKSSIEFNIQERNLLEIPERLDWNRGHLV